MQIIFENEDKRNNSREANSMNPVICTERISGCVKGEYVRRFGGREILGRIKKGVWRRR